MAEVRKRERASTKAPKQTGGPYIGEKSSMSAVQCDIVERSQGKYQTRTKI